MGGKKAVTAARTLYSHEAEALSGRVLESDSKLGSWNKIHHPSQDFNTASPIL